jgi:hypothetical protein
LGRRRRHGAGAAPFPASQRPSIPGSIISRKMMRRGNGIGGERQRRNSNAVKKAKRFDFNHLGLPKTIYVDQQAQPHFLSCAESSSRHLIYLCHSQKEQKPMAQQSRRGHAQSICQGSGWGSRRRGGLAACQTTSHKATAKTLY